MAEIRTGSSTVAIDDIVAEAIETLGFFHPRSLPFIADRIARLWGGNTRAFEMDGERIKPIADRPRYQVAGEIWGGLSAKGRVDPSYACEATWLRVTFNIRRVAERNQEEHWRTFATKASFACHEAHACAKARSSKGAVMALNKRTLGLFVRPVPLPSLPVAGCDADWCSCRWDVGSD